MIFEAWRVIRRVQSLLAVIGESSSSVDFRLVTNDREIRYALFEAGTDELGAVKERLSVYVNGIPLRRTDMSFEEVAIHETRHIWQFRRGKENFATYRALHRRMAAMCHNDERVHSAFARACTANPVDALEADATFVAVLAYDLEFPVDAALML